MYQRNHRTELLHFSQCCFMNCSQKLPRIKVIPQQMSRIFHSFFPLEGSYFLLSTHLPAYQKIALKNVTKLFLILDKELLTFFLRFIKKVRINSDQLLSSVTMITHCVSCPESVRQLKNSFLCAICHIFMCIFLIPYHSFSQ